MNLDQPKQYKEAAQINDLVKGASKIVIIQADNPDGDSLGSALALEQILHEMGKEPYLYCSVDMPLYLRYLEGWDRVETELPSNFDISIIVDTSADSLLANLNQTNQQRRLAAKPCIIIDHHGVEPTIEYATVLCIQSAVATGEVIYELAQQLDWKLNLKASELLTTSILSDSLGFSSEATTARSVYIVAVLVTNGVNLAQLENKRRDLMRKSPEILQFKGELLQRIEYFDDGKIATITIPWEEIKTYSHEYNPSVLVLDDMRSVTGVYLAIAFKLYSDGRVTAKIRCNFGVGIADQLAKHFGGGGHPYASGFKVQDGRSIDEIKSGCIKVASELLKKTGGS